MQKSFTISFQRKHLVVLGLAVIAFVTVGGALNTLDKMLSTRSTSTVPAYQDNTRTVCLNDAYLLENAPTCARYRTNPHRLRPDFPQVYDGASCRTEGR